MDFLRKPIALTENQSFIGQAVLISVISLVMELDLLMSVALVVLVLILSFYLRNQPIIYSLVLVLVFALVKLMKKENFDVINPKNDVYHECSEIKIEDIKKLFDNNDAKMKKELYELGFPLSIALNDTNAPRIATYLINKGMVVSEKCKFPPQLESEDVSDKGYIICSNLRPKTNN